MNLACMRKRKKGPLVKYEVETVEDEAREGRVRPHKACGPWQSLDFISGEIGSYQSVRSKGVT